VYDVCYLIAHVIQVKSHHDDHVLFSSLLGPGALLSTEPLDDEAGEMVPKL
jgi:hypothetical protein